MLALREKAALMSRLHVLGADVKHLHETLTQASEDYSKLLATFIVLAFVRYSIGICLSLFHLVGENVYGVQTFDDSQRYSVFSTSQGKEFDCSLHTENTIFSKIHLKFALNLTFSYQGCFLFPRYAY